MVAARIGDAGPVESEPVSYHWWWYWHLSNLGPWLLLALGIAVPRANRDRRALLIFIPMLVLALLWHWVAGWMGMPSADQTQFRFLIECLAVGLALLWLNADKLGGRHGLERFAMSLGLVLLADLVIAMFWAKTFPGDIPVLLVLTALVSIILLVSLTLTHRRSGRRYHPLRFMVWLAVWTMLCALAAVAIFVGVLVLTDSFSIRGLHAEVAAAGAAFGLCLFAIHLPYLLLMFTSPFFRRRFQIWLGVDSLSLHSGRVVGMAGS